MTYRILIVEDVELWQDRLRKMFEGRLGYEVHIEDEYLGAVEAINAAEEPYDLITVDMDIRNAMWDEEDEWGDGEKLEDKPGRKKLMGMQVLEHVRQYHRGEVCVIISGESFTLDDLPRFNRFKSVLARRPYSKFEDDLRAKLLNDVPRYLRRIFISYRRDDSGDITGRIFDRLGEEFGQPVVYRDVDSIPLGVDFRERIDRMISKSAVLLVVIGNDWLNLTDDEGRPRLETPNDYVRREIEVALEQGIAIIPILVHGASVPAPEDLPESIRELSYRNGFSLRGVQGFEDDIEELIENLERVLQNSD